MLRSSGWASRMPNAGRHTEEYMRVLAPLLRGQDVDFEGEDFRVHAAGMATPAPVSVLLGALGPRLLRVAGEIADGTILWMTNARAIESHVVPRIRAAAEIAGRPEPRIVAGLPVAVHDDVDEARAAAAEQFVRYANLPNYQQSMARGGIASPAEAVIVGNEDSVHPNRSRGCSSRCDGHVGASPSQSEPIENDHVLVPGISFATLPKRTGSAWMLGPDGGFVQVRGAGFG